MKITLIKEVSLLLLTTSVQTATLFFEVGTGSPDSSAMSIAGPNQEYVVQGLGTAFTTYSIDWQSTTHASSVKSINLNANANIADTRIQCGFGENCVVASSNIFRFNMKPGAANDFEEYSVPKGFSYDDPTLIAGTSYFLVASVVGTTANTKKAYRLFSDRVTEMKTFNTGENSRSKGALYGTSRFVISLDGTNQRKVFDYTNGYEGGTNSALETHTKQDNTNNEIGFFSVEDGRELYVVSSLVLKRIYTVQYDGTDWLHFDLRNDVPNVHPATWVKDSDFCVVATWEAQYFFIVNFVDKNKPIAAEITLPSGAKNIDKVGFWSDYKVFIVPSAATHRSYVYKALTETPCADLCATCDGIYRKKCLTCDQNASKTGDVCSCDFGFYEKNKSPTKKECLACSPLCGTCSAAGATDCLTCRDPNMERNGDGSCACKSGTYLSGSTCPLCDASCLTCSGLGPSACLSCNISKGRYLSGTTCPACDPSCKTCNSGSINSCLSCHIGAFLSGSTCLSCAASDSPNCPQPTKIDIPSSFQEGTQNITLSFSPALNSFRLPANFQFTAETLVEKFLSLKFKRKEESSSTPFTITSKALTHGTESSKLFVEFLCQRKT